MLDLLKEIVTIFKNTLLLRKLLSELTDDHFSNYV